MKKDSRLIIYQAKSGAIELKGDLKTETIWATQKQLAQVFRINIRTVSEHIKNIFKTKELKEISTVRKFRIVETEGARQVSRKIDHYNLDMIIAVGYRINSKRATKFRQWATKTLKQHITQGYTINRHRIAGNYQTFLQTVEAVKKLVAKNSRLDISSTLDLIKAFASTWVSLKAYDQANLPTTGINKRQVKIAAKDLSRVLTKLKHELILKKETSKLFAQERERGIFAGIVGDVFQSFDGKDLYPSVEEKATHLFYFIIKNHPSTDGNKRSGAFAFIWFLQKAEILDPTRFTPEALTALTLLIAESDPRKKERMVGLVLLLLKKD